MAAFEDSEPFTQQSQDLFDDDDARPERNEMQSGNEENPNTIAQILKNQERLLRENAELKAEVAKLREEASLRRGKKFTMEDCSFRKKLHYFLRERFSQDPWLDVSNPSFKAKARQFLAEDGVGDDGAAMRSVMSYSLKRYTEFRNQLRRTVLHRYKAEDLQVLSIRLFTKKVLGGFCAEAEETCTNDRVHFALVLRAFLHKNEYYVGKQGSNFWSELSEWMNEVKEDTRENKWEILREKDERRWRRYLNRSTED